MTTCQCLIETIDVLLTLLMTTCQCLIDTIDVLPTLLMTTCQCLIDTIADGYTYQFSIYIYTQTV